MRRTRCPQGPGGYDRGVMNLAPTPSAAAGDTAVSLSGVVALLGRFPALAGIDLTVERGEVVLLQGPNGAGKTTVLRLCAGLLRVESGRAAVLGHDLASDRRSVRRRVGLLGAGGRGRDGRGRSWLTPHTAIVIGGDPLGLRLVEQREVSARRQLGE